MTRSLQNCPMLIVALGIINMLYKTVKVLLQPFHKSLEILPPSKAKIDLRISLWNSSEQIKKQFLKIRYSNAIQPKDTLSCF